MSIKAKFNATKYLANLILKKIIQKQSGIMKKILPGDKVNAEEKAKFAIKKLQENANINVNNLTKSCRSHLRILPPCLIYCVAINNTHFYWAVI